LTKEYHKHRHDHRQFHMQAGSLWMDASSTRTHNSSHITVVCKITLCSAAKRQYAIWIYFEIRWSVLITVQSHWRRGCLEDTSVLSRLDAFHDNAL